MQNQSARIDFRLRREHKELIERAARAQGQTMSQFAIGALVRAAQESIQQAALTELSVRDRDAFLEMLESNEPNAALKKAAARYRSRGG